MFFVLAMTQNSWSDIGVSVALLIMAGLIGAFFKNRSAQKSALEEARKNNIMKDVDVKINKSVKPISDRMNKHDQDFKDFRKEEIEPIKEKVNDIDKRQELSDSKLDHIMSGMSKIENLVGKVFDILDKKQDKK